MMMMKVDEGAEGPKIGEHISEWLTQHVLAFCHFLLV